MRILLLGGTMSPVGRFLKEQGCDVEERMDRLPADFGSSRKYEFIVSYRYRYLIPELVVGTYEGRMINLHISLLPWNRGADPNLWSFLEDTPKGVTVHFVDTGLDTGNIVAQQPIELAEEGETLASTYKTLNRAVVELFKKAWRETELPGGRLTGIPQSAGGSFHRLRDKEPFLHLLDRRGWDTPVLEVKGKALDAAAQRKTRHE